MFSLEIIDGQMKDIRMATSLTRIVGMGHICHTPIRTNANRLQFLSHVVLAKPDRCRVRDQFVAIGEHQHILRKTAVNDRGVAVVELHLQHRDTQWIRIHFLDAHGMVRVHRVRGVQHDRACTSNALLGYCHRGQAEDQYKRS